MHDYSLWCPVVTICALLTTNRQMDVWMDGRRTKMGDISAAEMKAQAVLKSATHHIIAYFGKCTIPFANLTCMFIEQPFAHIWPNSEISMWNA